MTEKDKNSNCTEKLDDNSLKQAVGGARDLINTANGIQSSKNRSVDGWLYPLGYCPHSEDLLTRNEE